MGRSKRYIQKTGIFAVFLVVSFVSAMIAAPTKKSNADEINVGLGVSSFIAISTDADKLSLETTVNSFVSGVITPSVSTNSAYGHTMRISAVGDDTNMTSATSSDVVTSSFAGQLTSDNMPTNSWGFSLNSTNYRRIPVQSSAVNISTSNTPSASNATSVPVRIGIKVGMLTSGKYSGTMLFTAYTNGVDGKPENDDPNWTGEDTGIDPMQGFQCTRMASGETRTMKDTRDNNQYTVTKLADGNCWMTQNLRLVGAKTLTPADSDVSANFTLPAERSWVHDWYTPYDGPTGSSVYGAYYNIQAATAGTVSTIVDGETQSSVCPKGWKLPTKTDFDNIISLYGITNDAAGQAIAMAAPLNFVKGGLHNGGWLYHYQGQRGYYFSSTPASGTSVNHYSLNLMDASSIKVDSVDNSYGFTVRCISRI